MLGVREESLMTLPLNGKYAIGITPMPVTVSGTFMTAMVRVVVAARRLTVS